MTFNTNKQYVKWQASTGIWKIWSFSKQAAEVAWVLWDQVNDKFGDVT